MRKTIFYILFSPLLLLSCEDGFFTSQSDNKYALQISYEEETISFTEFSDDNTSGNNMNAILAEPKIERNKIEIGIFDNGSGELTITSVEPKNEFKPSQPPLPSPEQPAKSIKFSGGRVYYMDSNNKVFHSHDDETPDFTPYLEYYKAIKQRNSIAWEPSQLLKSGTFEGQPIVGEKETVYVKIFDTTDDVTEEYQGKKSVVFVDNFTGLVNRSALFNADGTFAMRSLNTYKADASLPIPHFSRTETFNSSDEPSAGEMFVSLSTTENLQIIDNL